MATCVAFVALSLMLRTKRSLNCKRKKNIKSRAAPRCGAALPLPPQQQQCRHSNVEQYEIKMKAQQRRQHEINWQKKMKTNRGILKYENRGTFPNF